LSGVTSGVTSVVKMDFKIVGELTFYILQWDTDHLVIGWEAMRRLQLLGKLKGLIAIQETQGLRTGVSSSDENRELTDMNGRTMSTDELLFADEPEIEAPPPVTELTPAKEKEISQILEKYQEDQKM
jgi:hypothetical protein